VSPSLFVSIEELNLSPRTATPLRRLLLKRGISRVYQLVCLQDSDLLRERGFGRKALAEVKERLLVFGLCLGMTIEAEMTTLCDLIVNGGDLAEWRAAKLARAIHFTRLPGVFPGDTVRLSVGRPGGEWSDAAVFTMPEAPDEFR